MHPLIAVPAASKDQNGFRNQYHFFFRGEQGEYTYVANKELGMIEIYRNDPSLISNGTYIRPVLRLEIDEDSSQRYGIKATTYADSEINIDPLARQVIRGMLEPSKNLSDHIDVNGTVMQNKRINLADEEQGSLFEATRLYRFRQ
jgi:hypothetical protein